MNGTMVIEPQRKDPLARAAEAYCRARHTDAGIGGACDQPGTCETCHSMAALVVRAYMDDALT
jgi:hypothetical protein